MTTTDIIIVVIAAIVAGIFAPMIVKWIIRNQRNWKHKIIKEN